MFVRFTICQRVSYFQILKEHDTRTGVQMSDVVKEPLVRNTYNIYILYR